jgi:CheY-like chemotaxis protein
MAEEYDIKGMSSKIKSLRKTATELKSMSEGIQAVDRNVDRILANVRMLEIDVVEVADILGKKKSR